MNTVTLTDPGEPRVIAALARGCNICAVPPGQHCRNLRGLKLAGGQIVHFHRAGER